ncbi:vacuolar proton translocating ATPase subunit A, putative [Plasmodium chabaudi chabaudi]|uniref:V-type proton ATPase subunit a n=2 Tax=Plasmodium chabaudi TaxID=5825 RepID=A0A077TS14_PLACU|nr:V-type proton ATPase subunit a, putative [Plasmodium chabaudi chabaudi]SCM23155.1 vacuolar proton translocating ATPase subunit A, putative [Plasmodium chabaudi adami]SCM24887.1 vacuolar proton translocating ATPase subunit A, putative [Plasmodium chabaudi chabaudi]SCN62139.1 vacuolar proton translocating ATPase subunit A, putative [Plasmodium chabaudi chabaudi]VTZ69716.1 V-type proton ATPase subunit a, putative [Plasmodium chabaudi chabaudi]|eukprot:XP_016654268.1 vacuolar proton translocating ATPase subunit A, putative [Plasmodium chabaudi chabaudi]
MGIFRSETMKHGTLVLPADRAREYMDCLGKQVDIQFIDMNEKTMKRQYKKYIQRIDDMERILRFLEENINKLPNVKIKKSKIENFLEHDHIYELDQVEESLNRLHVQFVRFCNNNKDLVDERNSAIEEKHVILTALNQLHPDMSKRSNLRSMHDDNIDENNLMNNSEEDASLSTHIMREGINMMFTNISGVIKTKDQESFSRTIFRALRGNTYTYFQNIDENMNSSGTLNNENSSLDNKIGEDNNENKENNVGGNSNELKSVFVVYCHGSTHSSIYEKIMKICKAYDVRNYEWPKTYEQATKRLSELKEIINDKEKALKAYEEYFINEIFVLINVVEPNKNSLIEEWKLFCKKERHIYNNLNYFEGSDITLRCDCWYSANDEEKIRHILMNKSSNDLVSALLLSDKLLTPNISPPTYIKTNEFTSTYQSMVDTYGIPRYGEINPAISTIVTFPFLFGIMYGDVGHGICIFLFALFLIIVHNRMKNKEGSGSGSGSDENSNEMLSMLFNGRYMLLLMGFFAVYAGFLYNDFFSMPLNLFTSMFEVDKVVDSVEYYKRKQILNAETGQMEDAPPYIFGFDSKWLGADNELTYINSFKMKFSIIIGFCHMTFGVIIKGFNALHFKKKMDFFFEFLPQFVMMLSMIGYLVFLIIYKWVTPIGYGGYKKQGIINTIINMYLMKEINQDNQFYEHQEIVQAIIITLFALCIPVMLFCKPAIKTYKMMKEKKKRMAMHYQTVEKEMTNQFNGVGIIGNTADGRDMISSYGNNSMHKRVTKIGYDNSVGNHDAENEDEYLLLKRRGRKTDDEMEAHLLGPSSYHSSDDANANHGSDEHEENLSEIWIEQLIETIEFILGLISNTASYLRLWALSLAHQQLSLVFFEQTILSSLEKDSFMGVLISLIIFSQLFSILTIAVILCMDTLECFLHSLRLQWVEFQNKFYKGDGIPFKPFNIKKLLSERD